MTHLFIAGSLDSVKKMLRMLVLRSGMTGFRKLLWLLRIDMVDGSVSSNCRWFVMVISL